MSRKKKEDIQLEEETPEVEETQSEKVTPPKKKNEKTQKRYRLMCVYHGNGEREERPYGWEGTLTDSELEDVRGYVLEL